MDDIVKLYNEHLTTSFPDRGGDEVLGIDLLELDSDTAGLISKYIGSRGQLSTNDFRILNHCFSDLKVIVKELNDADGQYFAQLQNIAGFIIEEINNNKREKLYDFRTIDKPEWESTFLKIREILNDWDPVGVADTVDDAYDTMNFRTLSVLVNNGDKKEIMKILDEYTRMAMQLTVDSDTLDKVADRISRISAD